MHEREIKRLELDPYKEFWDNHNFNDDCPVDKDTFIPDPAGCLRTPITIIEALRDVTRERKQRKQIFNDLKEYLATIEGQPIKRLLEGDVFDVSEYTIGTVVHYSRDFQSQELKKPYSDVYWGILTQEEVKGNFRDVVYSFSEDALSNDNRINLLGSRLSQVTEIGAVDHFKFQISPFTVSQSLRRINWLEVWKYGQQVREEQKENAKELHPILNPQL